MSSDARDDAGAGAEAGADGSAPLLSLDGIEVEFGSDGIFGFFEEEKVSAVDGVSLDVEENDVVALVGESGCGKTTLGKTAVGLQRPTSGSVRYRGTDIWEARRGGTEVPFDDIRRALQIVHQDPGSSLNSYRSVRAILSEPLRTWYPSLSADERYTRIVKVLERVGVTPAQDFANRYPHQLSGGEAQRIALARSLLVNPDFILADEAVSALDVSLRVDVMDLMIELQDVFDTSYLFISHDLANARYLAEKADGRIGVMYMGNIVEIGTPEEILTNPQHPYTKVMLWATPILDPDIARGVATEDLPVRSLDTPDPTDPPSGCRFHTRCPMARETCTREEPALEASDDGAEVACFRAAESHEYWESEFLDPEAAESKRIDWDY